MRAWKGERVNKVFLSRLGGLVLVSGFLAGPSLKAGVYNFAEPKDFMDPKAKSEWDKFYYFRPNLLLYRDIMGVALKRRDSPLANISFPGRLPHEAPILQRYILIMYTGARGPWDKMSLDQKLNLSAYLLRCRREFEARELLEPLARTNPDNFLVFANLATTYYYLNELPRAIAYQTQALEAWPDRYDDLKPDQKKFLDRMGFDQADHQFYRGVEKSFLLLLEERQAEELKGVKSYTTVDPLFKDVRGPIQFVDDKGEYVPGKLAATERVKLPVNHMEHVQQLLYWLPDDNRLYWLYGELLAAHGEIKAAKRVFEDLKDMVPAKEFRRHRTILESTPNPPEPVDPNIREADIGVVEKKLDDLQNPPPYPFRDLFLSFLVGAAVALFGYWQFQEIRRRHQPKATLAEGGATSSPASQPFGQGPKTG